MVYDVAYVAFYNDCTYRTNPVTSGSRLSLVYDLVTPTIADVPLSAGTKLLQRAVDTALVDFFSLHLEAKWGIADEHVVYAVISDATFEELSQEERDVAKSLAAFCASTNGAYTLYLAELECKCITRQRHRGNDPDDESDFDDETKEITLWLQSPWLPYVEWDEPVGNIIKLSPKKVIASYEFCDALHEAEWEIEQTDDDAPSEKTQWFSAHALVVQAAAPPRTNKKHKTS